MSDRRYGLRFYALVGGFFCISLAAFVQGLLPMLYPLELAEVGADDLGDLVCARLGLQHRQQALHEGGQRDAKKAADQGVEAQAVASVAHGVALASGAPPMGWAAGASAASTVRIRLNTSSVMPMSIEIPASVRTSQ